MSILIKISIILYLLLILGCGSAKKETGTEINSKSDTIVSLENDSSKLSISLMGGSLISFQSKISPVNPFNWKETDNGSNTSNKSVMSAQGQFLSIGRWSLPTAGESKLGMPRNGEPANNWWKLESVKYGKELKMNCEAPLDGFLVSRSVVLSQSDPLFKVTETITNEFSIGRVCTIIQNLILSTPFFNPAMRLNCNASYGFNQDWGMPEPNVHEYKWPLAFIDTLKISTIDLSRFSTKFQYTSSFVFSDSIGWITAYNPKLKLLLGYVWKTNEYPWLHIKNEINYGKPDLHGISFGTTGLNDKYSFENRLTTTFHKVRNFDFIDAKSSLVKQWYCFMINLDEDLEQTLNVAVQNDRIFIKMATSKGFKEIKLTL
jgi:hypothetical protein